MADLNALIAQGAQFRPPPDPFAQYAQMQQLQQGQQANQLNQLKMQEYQRGMQEEQDVRNRLAGGGAIDSPDMTSFLLGSKTGRDIIQRRGELQKATTEEQTRRAKLAADTEAAYRNMSSIIGTRDDAVSFLQRMAVDPALKGSPIASLPLELQVAKIPEDPKALNDWVKQFAIGSTKWVTENKPITVPQGASVYRPGDTEALFTAPGAAPKLADKFVPVGKLVFDRETGQFITPPAAAIAATQDRGAAAPAPAKEPVAKPLTAMQEAARRDKLGKEYKATTSALQTTQDVLDSIAAVKSSPGLSRATGFSGTMLPSFPEGQAAQAETRLANLKGKVTALGKAAAAASGAIGSIANQEWKILSDQIANIDPVKGTGPLLEQIDLVEAQARGAMERIRDSYGRQFGEDFERFPQFGNLPQPKSTQRKPAETAAPAGASGNFTAPPPAAVDALKKGQGTDAQFDELFGPGAAARAKGR